MDPLLIAVIVLGVVVFLFLLPYIGEPLLLLCVMMPLKLLDILLSYLFCCWPGRQNTEFLPQGSVKKVAVIGAGPSGIVCAKEAIQAGFDVTVFEASDQVGGLWVFRENEAHSTVYRSTFINTTKQVMTYSDYPFPDDFPTYPSHFQLCRYFNDYCKHFGVDKKIQFRTLVIDVDQTPDNKWKVTTRPFDESKEWVPSNRQVPANNVPAEQMPGAHTQIFDAVFISNGHHSQARWPKYPGQETFQGFLSHSHSYKDPNSCGKGYDFRGKRVAVVGIGNSGSDIASELSRCTKQVYLSTRSGSFIFPKYIGGKPLDSVAPKRYETVLIPSFLRRSLALVWFQAKKVQRLIENQTGSMESWGLSMPGSSILSAHPTVSHDILSRIGNGTIKVVKDIKRLNANSFVTVDDQEFEVDAIVFATGYAIKFPFLKPELHPVKDPKQESEENSVYLYKQIFSPHLPPTLAHVGLIQPFGAIQALSEMQARWVCAVWTGRCGLPRPEVQREYIESYLSFIRSRYTNRPRHTIQVDQFDYMPDLAQEIGCEPSLLFSPSLWCLAKELLFAPAGWPLHFRLQGPGAWDGAKKALAKAYAQISETPYQEASTRAWYASTVSSNASSTSTELVTISISGEEKHQDAKHN